MEPADAWREPMAGRDVRPIGVFEVMVRACLPGAVYTRVATEWTGWGLRYLAVLAVVSFSVWLVAAWIPAIRELPGLEAELAGFPDLEIRAGVVRSSVPQPYEWVLDGETILLDLESTATPEQVERARVWLGPSRLVIQRNEWEHRTYDLSEVQEFSVDAARFTGWIRAILLFGPPALAVVGGLAWFGWRALIGLAWGALALAAGAPDFRTGVRVGLVATTPIVWLGTLWVVVGWTPPYWFVLSLGLLAAYVWDAGRRARRPA